MKTKTVKPLTFSSKKHNTKKHTQNDNKIIIEAKKVVIEIKSLASEREK